MSRGLVAAWVTAAIAVGVLLVPVAAGSADAPDGGPNLRDLPRAAPPLVSTVDR
jgi:hypothetical protein